MKKKQQQHKIVFIYLIWIALNVLSRQYGDINTQHYILFMYWSLYVCVPVNRYSGKLQIVLHIFFRHSIVYYICCFACASTHARSHTSHFQRANWLTSIINTIFESGIVCIFIPDIKCKLKLNLQLNRMAKKLPLCC